MSEKILEVRFVNFEDGRVAVEWINHTPKGLAFPFFLGEPNFIDVPFIDAQKRIDAWIETLNSGEREVPRIERQKGEEGYRVHTCGTHIHFIIGEESLQALNQIYGKEAPIYEPKKYEAKWVQIFPREIKPYELCFDKTVACDDCVRRADFINQLQQTEAGTFEVWSLTVYEESV